MNNQKVTSTVKIGNARIIFRNFSGKPGPYNPPGRRTFCVLLPDELGHQMKDDGWNIKWLEPREEGDMPQAYMTVRVNFSNSSIQVVAISGGTRTNLSEQTIGILDWADIDKADLVVRPYNWDMNGKTGVTAYLNKMYVNIVEDEFDVKYRDVPYSKILSENDDQQPPWSES